jgi:hypothetical protein
LIVIGQPTDGKSRTVYEIVRQMKGWIVASPAKQSSVKLDEALAALKGKRIVLLAEDLQEYVGGSVDLGELLSVW